MRTVLITGGAGFIGSNFIAHWLGRYKDDKIVNLDAMTYAARHAYVEKYVRDRECKDRYQLELCDIGHRYAVEQCIRHHKPDLIVHFAAESHVCRSIQGPEPFFHTNVLGTFNLIEEARRYWGNAENRFHHVSTDEVFGELKNDDPPFCEMNPLVPRSPYATSKAASDMIVNCYRDTYGMNVTISNCSNNYGPNQHLEKLIPRTIERIFSGGDVTVYGSGQQRRDWLHVYDHCSAIDTIIHRGQRGARYCVGGENELTNLEVIRKVAAALEVVTGQKREIKYSFTNDRPTDDRRYAIDTTRIRSLDWKPMIDFSWGLTDTCSWYLDILRERAAERAGDSGLMNL